MNLETPCTPFPTVDTSVDLVAIKARQKTTWASGDFAIIGTTLQIVGESLCEAIDLRSGERVLDVACGNGNATLAAARRWAHVTGTDYVPELLVKARKRAEAECLEVDLVEGDAEALPFADASFDVVLSTFGVMFAPNQVAAATELVRVCRPRGRIGLANWTPAGFIGELFGVVGRHVPPPKGVLPPSLWGKREHLAALFGDEIAKLEVTPKDFCFRYESAQHFIDIFRKFYGPTHKAFAALDADRAAELAADIEALIHRYDRGNGRGIVVPAEYLEVVATMR
ncbi:MAG: methyltransferase domain-containing protein [Polyangiaceae bacterium]|nr:methyltransferase domain-containing protein [Polyangiaceae bacterium]